jgi:hypothetical protein
MKETRIGLCEARCRGDVPARIGAAALYIASIPAGDAPTRAASIAS